MSRTSGGKRRWAREIGMFGTSIVGAFALSRLASGATSAAVASAALAAVVVAVLQRRPALAIAAGMVTAAGSALAWGVRVATQNGTISIHGLSVVRRSLQTAHVPLAAFQLPLPHTPGIVTLCAMFAGLAAVAGRGLGTRAPVLSCVPAAGLLVWSTIAIPTTGAALGALVLGACCFLVLGSDRNISPPRSVTVGMVSLGAAALTLLVTNSAYGSGAASPGGQPVPAVAPSALSLATDLLGVETKDANVVLFEARAPTPTYWQVTTLTRFVGDRWVPDPATDDLLHGAPPVATTGFSNSGVRLFTTRITLAAYSGRLLPVPPSTVGVTGASSPVVTASGVVATKSPKIGSTYTATAAVPEPVADTSGLPLSPDGDTDLGPVPPSVRKLALSITADQSTPLGKAEALTDYFRSGAFHYSTTAATTKSSGSSSSDDPLETFLTKTKTGSCEQFAGAFAVMARVSGLSTRVAVGFAPGRRIDGLTVVRGGDAHAWPEVYLDGGWVSFEPTPQLPSGELSPPGVLGPSGLGQPNPTGPSPTPSSIPTPSSVPPTSLPNAIAHQGTGAGRAGSSRSLTLGIGVVGIVVIAGVSVMLWLRRRRAPLDQVVRSWHSIDKALARRGLARPVAFTPSRYVRALSEHQTGEQAAGALGDMETVATMLRDVTYGSVELAPADAARAVRAGRRARRAILSGALSGQGGLDVVGSPTGLGREEQRARTGGP